MACLNEKKKTVSNRDRIPKSVAYLESQYRRKLLIFNLKPAPGFGSSIDRAASTFIGRSQFTGQLIIRPPGFEPITMAHEQFTEQIGVGPIVFGAATEEGFTIISQLAGIDRIELEELISH
jgi:hypothetical protein